MKSVTVTERHALIALGIFVAAIVAYFWYKNQIALATNAGYNQGANDVISLNGL